MSAITKIEWTDTTWNPVTGCTPISDGCKYCYAMRMAKRLKAMGNKRYASGFKVTLHHDLIERPLHWCRSRMVFVNSMSDLFHEEIPLEFIQKVFATMNQAHNHIFQVLTKRSSRLVEVCNELVWTKNIWMGVTVESQKYLYRAKNLRSVPASIRFLSVEPMLSSLHLLQLDGIDWVIVGGESGPGSRVMKREWVQDIRDNCVAKRVPFFFKQWGGTNKKKAGRILDGETWNQFPVVSLDPEHRNTFLS